MLKIFNIRLLVLLVLTGCGSDDKPRQESPDKAIVYHAGYKVISFVDSSRTYRPDVETSSPLHFRPIDVDLWYPAHSNASDSTLRFWHFLKTLEQRANFYSAPQVFHSLPTTTGKSFCEAFSCSQADVLLQHPTATFKQAKPASGKFPLILYLASFGSMGYENYLLFESLASQGYIVACVSSIGRYPGDMTMKNADLIQQVMDAEKILNRMKKDDRVDTSRIGLLGYSWGGLAGALLAMKREDIRTIVSLDGSEVHHYGYSKSEDQDFDYTVNTPDFKNATLSIPYLRLESNPEPGKTRTDSSYNFLSKVSREKSVVKIDSAGHQDFSSLPSVVRASGRCALPKVYSNISALTISHFNKHLKSIAKEPK
jgi:pimeloyl-ACP methyl ester carboxylesterase